MLNFDIICIVIIVISYVVMNSESEKKTCENISLVK